MIVRSALALTLLLTTPAVASGQDVGRVLVTPRETLTFTAVGRTLGVCSVLPGIAPSPGVVGQVFNVHANGTVDIVWTLALCNNTAGVRDVIQNGASPFKLLFVDEPR